MTGIKLGLELLRRADENPFHGGRLPLASIGPRFARASPTIRGKQPGRVLFGDGRGEFRPHLGAHAKYSHGSYCHERQADNTSDKSTDDHCLFPPTLSRTPALPSWRRYVRLPQRTRPCRGQIAAARRPARRGGPKEKPRGWRGFISGRPPRAEVGGVRCLGPLHIAAGDAVMAITFWSAPT
jgi:hypothetical protein